MKICISTDFHLSYRQYGMMEREQDFYHQYEKLIDKVVEENPDLFIELGDIFDTPYPKPISIKVFEEGLNRLKDHDIECYGIMGNHTLIQRKGFYPIDKIFHDKITILDGTYIIKDSTFICGIRYHPRTHDIKSKIDKLYEESEGCKLKILLLHQILKKEQNIGYDFDEDILKLNRFDYVFLGHLHKRVLRYDEITDSVIHYPGSLNSCNVIEMADEMENGRGYTIFDTDTLLLEMKNIKHPRDYIQYNLTDDELNEECVDEVYEYLKGLLVKPIVELNIETNDAKHAYDTVKRLDEVSCSMKVKTFQPVRKMDFAGPAFDGLNDVDSLLRSNFNEEWEGDFAIELLHLLGNRDIESAKELVKHVYEEHFFSVKKQPKNRNI